MNITLPELSLVVLIGPSGAGKSTFAHRHFKPTEILSSDACRGWVSDDENDQSATQSAFEVLHFIAAKRLAAARLTVVDATNVQSEARKPLIALARQYHCLPVAIVLDLPEKICRERNRGRPERSFGEHVIRNQRQHLHRSLRKLEREGFRHVHVLRSVEEIEAAEVIRQPLWNNKKHECGPFDLVGDIHGCFDELCDLLQRLGYEITQDGQGYRLSHPQGRKAIFVGDLVDRGPKTPEVLRLAMDMVKSGAGYCVAGNHDVKLMRKLKGREVKVSHGLAESLRQLELESVEFRKKTIQFLDGLVSHYVFDGGKLVIAHAGLKEEMQGRGSGRVREFALYGETTGETDEYGLPVRHNWAADYRGRAMVIYGHTPVPKPEWLNNTLCIDTGCVFGGHLTALRYPERELVSVPARQTYYDSIKPFLPENTTPSPLTAQQQADDLLDIQDVLGKRIIGTRLRPNITVREENAAAALDVMSRFAANPKWLIYLPPTMSPSQTSHEENYLEHPKEALAYYRQQGLEQVVCQEKHMGSRAVIVICRDEQAARRHFGVENEGTGIIYTRTGRRFFGDAVLEGALLRRLGNALSEAGFWQAFNSDWFCLDGEIMPWSAKAQDLLRSQYAAVGAASQAALAEVNALLQRAQHHGVEVTSLRDAYQGRAEMASRYVEAYRRYCWPVAGIDDLRIAPFHVLASNGQVHADKTHLWHLQTLAKLAEADPGWLLATPYQVIDLHDDGGEQAAIDWWLELTARGGEGMVVKPLHFTAYGKRGLIQPAVKCRGSEYLRIIYGPEYTAAQHLERLRARGLAAKRQLALKEFALGIEALERFVNKEPLRRVHECVFGILALESEPVDPRL